MKHTIELINSDTSENQNSSDVFKAICQDAAEAVDADLVSVWLFDADHTSITSQAALDVKTGKYTSNAVLKNKDYPTYFKTIINEFNIVAPDVKGHPATVELVDSYFKPLGVISLLDFILHKDGKAVGVLCCENRRYKRDWSVKDSDYLRGLVTIAAYHFNLLSGS